MRVPRSTSALTMFPALLASVLLAIPVHADGADCGRDALEVVYDDDANRLIVVDGEMRRVTLFQVGQALIKTGSSSFAGATGRASSVAVPESDAPGEDPPGWVRPAGAVRVQSSYRTRPTVRWDAVYLVPGDPLEVFESARTGLDGWEVESVDVGTDLGSGRRRAGLDATRGELEIDLELDDRQRLPDGWTTLRVQVRTRR